MEQPTAKLEFALTDCLRVKPNICGLQLPGRNFTITEFVGGRIPRDVDLTAGVEICAA
jgi:hypothetical protein